MNKNTCVVLVTLGLILGFGFSTFTQTRDVYVPQWPADCSVHTYTSLGEIRLSRDGSDLILNGERVCLFATSCQMESHDGRPSAGKVRLEVSKERVLNANVLCCLLANTDLIPESWKTFNVYFWGTTYERDGIYLVQFLFWDESMKKWDHFERCFASSPPARESMTLTNDPYSVVPFMRDGETFDSASLSAVISN